VPVEKVIVTFCHLFAIYQDKVGAVISFFVEQQDALAVKYSASSIRSVIYSILIDDYEGRKTRYQSSALLIGQIFKQACSYRLKGSSDLHCRSSDVRLAIDAMVCSKDILFHRYKDGIIYCELPTFVRNNIDYYKEIHYTGSGRLTSNEDRQVSYGKTKSMAEAAYQKEKKRQEAVAASRKQGHYVYYIQWDNDPGFVKIGYSSSPAGRITGFLTGNPRSLQVLRLEPVASAQDELARHSTFNEYRHAREWFRYEGALREYVQSLSVDPAIKLWQQLPATSKDAIKVEYF
jgi:T5orf172 domain